MLTIKGQEFKKESQYPLHRLGEGAESVDGRKFRYSWMGEAITVGRLATSGAIDTALTGMTVITGAKGDKHIDFTNAATTTTATYFDEGYAVVSLGTGLGQIFRIKSLPALVSGATSIVYLEDPIETALDTTSRLDLVQHPNSQVLMTATATLNPVGVSLMTFTTQYYGWLQTRGVCAVHNDNTIAAGTAVFNDGSEAGGVDIATEAAWVVNPMVGRAYQLAGADTYHHPVFLTIE